MSRLCAGSLASTPEGLAKLERLLKAEIQAKQENELRHVFIGGTK